MTEEILHEDIIKTCPICGGEFIVSSKHIIYCSDLCLKKAKTKKGKPITSKSKVKECKGCSKLFQTDRYNPDQKYCSQECYYKSVMKKDKKDEPKEHTEPVRVVCSRCGTPFKTSRKTTLCPLCRELR